MEKAIRVKQHEQRLMGDEPQWEPGKEYTDLELGKAYNWYNYVLNPKERQEIVAKYVDKNQAKLIRKAKPYQITNKLASLIRMESRGLTLNSELSEYISDQIKQLTEQEQEEVVAKHITPVFAQEVVNTTIGDMEEQIDKFLLKYESDFDVFAYAKTRNLNRKQSEYVASYYTDLVSELDGVINKSDKDLVQAYSHHKPRGLKKYREFVNNFVVAFTTQKIVRVRKIRKKKVDAKKLVARVQYLQEDKDTGLTSLDPTKLLNAREVWLYNTKTRQLYYYVADTNEGILVKGTTLLNFSETSEGRKIRKPETLKAMIELAPKTLLNTFRELKVKPVPCNGRVNKFTLIVKATK